MSLAKTDLRDELRARRRGLARACPDAAERAPHGLELGRIDAFRVAAIYRAMGSELDPEPVAQWLEGQGVAIALPVVVRENAPLAFRLRAGATLAPDAIGVQAPAPDAPQVRPDLVITPLLAFDAGGGRLGQGGGYYDRTLAALRAEGPVFALGLAYAGQEIDSVPMDPYDQRLDGVLTEDGLRLFDERM